MKSLSTEIPTVSIKGNNYTLVSDRVMFFRTQDTYKGWRLVTEPFQLDEKIAVFRASVYDNEDKLVSCATAMEMANKGFINKDSHVENAETSAVGRALGFLGIGIVGGIAPADDMKNIPQITDEQIADLEALMKQKGSDKMALLGYFKVGSYQEMTPEIYANAIAMLSKKKNKPQEKKDEAA